MKELTCLLIRHGKTKGNLNKNYIGSKTDEPLCDEGIKELTDGSLDLAGIQHYSKVYVSPMIRCRQTADILFPEVRQICIEDFKEIDFGEFENKNFLELSGNEAYQKWIDSNGTMPFPGGESRENFIQRNVKAFREILINETVTEGALPFVIHGGSIMAIMSELTGGDYFDFQVSCKEAYLVKCLVREDSIDVISYDRISGGNNT